MSVEEQLSQLQEELRECQGEIDRGREDSKFDLMDAEYRIYKLEKEIEQLIDIKDRLDNGLYCPLEQK